jgi:outer membrane lipoprotein-sorting protein
MRQRNIVPTVIVQLITLLFLHGTLLGAGVTGEWVARKMSDRDTGKDSRVEMDMSLVDSRGRTTKRDLFMVQKDYNGNKKMLLRFTKPADIRGTSFLVWEHEDKDDERFLYLPALGRTRRITSAEKTDSFAGTDFTYEDISGREVEDFTYRLLGDSTVATGESCYVLESTPRSKDFDYAKTVALVDKESFLPLRVDYYNKGGIVFKRFVLEEKKKVDGIWTMMEMTMEDLDNRHKTHISVTRVQYNRGIEDRLFTRRELERETE